MTLPRVSLEGRQGWLLGVAGAAIGVAVCIRFLYLPVIAGIGERRATLTELRVKLADAQTVAAQLPSQEQVLQETQERFRVLERRLGDGQTVSTILESLSALAKEHHIEVVAVQPEETVAHEVPLSPTVTLREVPLTLQLTGRYRNVGEFLGMLPSAPFVASVRALKISKLPPAGATLRAELALAVYLMKDTAHP